MQQEPGQGRHFAFTRNPDVVCGHQRDTEIKPEKHQQAQKN